MTPPLAVVLGAAAAAAELRTLAAAIVEEPIAEEAIAAEERIGEEAIAAASRSRAATRHPRPRGPRTTVARPGLHRLA